MPQKKIVRPEDCPGWFDGKAINEADFCRQFLRENLLAYAEHSFFTPEGKLTDENSLRTQILTLLEPFVRAGVTKKIDNIVSLLRIIRPEHPFAALCVFLRVLCRICRRYARAGGVMTLESMLKTEN